MNENLSLELLAWLTKAGLAGTPARDAMAHRGAQLDRALPHECCADRLFLRERGMGEAAATGRRGFREAASRRPIQIARRQALS